MEASSIIARAALGESREQGVAHVILLGKLKGGKAQSAPNAWTYSSAIIF